MAAFAATLNNTAMLAKKLFVTMATSWAHNKSDGRDHQSGFLSLKICRFLTFRVNVEVFTDVLHAVLHLMLYAVIQLFGFRCL